MWQWQAGSADKLLTIRGIKHTTGSLLLQQHLAARVQTNDTPYLRQRQAM